MAHPDIARPETALIDRLRRLATSTLANALDDVGLHDNSVVAVKAVAPGFRFVGTPAPFWKPSTAAAASIMAIQLGCNLAR